MFWLIGAAWALLPFVAFVMAWVALARQRREPRVDERLSQLSDRILQLELRATQQARAAEATSAAAPPPVPESPPVAEPPPETPVASAQPAPASPEPEQPEEVRRPVWATAEPARPRVSAPVPAKPAFDWERFVGLRLPIWLGAIALCVAGFFFVSYAIESGFFTPEMRVASAALAALAFLAGAEAARRRMRTGNARAIAAALVAAAIATAYATAFLATRVYDLFPSGLGLIATIGVSIAALVIALSYGQIVALVGIVGAYVAPIVYGGGTPSAPFVMIYVTAITAVAFALIAFRSWWRLTTVGLLGPALWMLIWAVTPELLGDAFWSDAFLIAIPVIVGIASWRGWQADGPIRGLRGLMGQPTPERMSLIAAMVLACVGFVAFLLAPLGPAAFNITVWEGLLSFGLIAMVAGFLSPSHRALQLPVMVTVGIALILWPAPDRVGAYLVIGCAGVIFGFGALDQFRRLREPGFWAIALAAIVLALYGLALFKIDGWADALANKHPWALGALALAAGFVALLRLYGRRVAEAERDQVYAAFGGAATTLVSIALALELDPAYWPAAAALAVLGLSAVYQWVPVRGLRVVAVAYLSGYALLLFGNLFWVALDLPFGAYVLSTGAEQHALILMLLPGAALIGAGSLFQRAGVDPRQGLVPALDVFGLIALAIGLHYFIFPQPGLWPWTQMYVRGGPEVSAELALALAAVDGARRLGRPTLYSGGLVLTGIMSLIVLLAFALPLLSFWPDFTVPGPMVFNMALLAFALPALLLFGLGWLIRQDTLPNVRIYGIAVSVFAVLVAYALMLVEIRQAWHLDAPTLRGDTSQSEFYTYSIATLLFGIALLVFGVMFRNRGARALSFVFVLLTTLKVFLFDAAELDGLWRVLSFLLMGLSLLGISWAYARFVFGIGRRGGKPSGPQAGDPAPEAPAG